MLHISTIFQLLYQYWIDNDAFSCYPNLKSTVGREIVIRVSCTSLQITLLCSILLLVKGIVGNGIGIRRLCALGLQYPHPIVVNPERPLICNHGNGGQWFNRLHSIGVAMTTTLT